MRKILLTLVLLVPLLCDAQAPFIDALPPIDTNTLHPLLPVYVVAKDSICTVWAEFGFNSGNLYDQSIVTVLAPYATTVVNIPIAVVCDSIYFYHIAAGNYTGISCTDIFSFSAPKCSIGILELGPNQGIHIFPNPVTSISEIKAPPNTHIEIYDLFGQKKNMVTVNGAEYVYKKDFVSGIYVYKASCHGKVVRGKFCVE